MADKNVLEEVGEKIGIEVPKDFDPKKFFKTRKGLYVWSDFKERILDKAPDVSGWPVISVDSFKLKESANDEEIEKSLLEKHIFSESEVCAAIADLIQKQSKGEEGVLQNNGYANLFYTKDFVVRVYWRVFHGEWNVDAWDRGDDHWDGSCRVFSPAAVL